MTGLYDTGTVYSQSDLRISGCAQERNWLPITIDRSSVGIGLSGPPILDRCGIETYTLSLTKNGYVVYDLLAIFDLDPDGDGTNNYEFVAGSTVFTGTFTEDGGGNISAFAPDTSTPGELRWDFSTRGGLTGDLTSVGNILVDLRMPCSAAIHTYEVETEYNDRCDDGTIPRKSTVSAGPTEPMWVREGNISMVKMPEVYYATEEIAEWSLTVINGGDGAAYNLHVIDTLETDLSYYFGTPVPENVSGQVATWNFQSLTATWDDLTDLDGDGYFNDLIAGGTVTVTIYADLIACVNLFNEVYSEWGCLTTGSCQSSNLAVSEVLHPAPGLLGVTTFPATIVLCKTADVVMEVRNSGQAHVYDVFAREALPQGANYISGTSEYRYNDGSGWTGYTGTPDPAYWASQTHVPKFADLPASARVQIRFEVEADCDFPSGDRVFRSQTGYTTPCQQYLISDETKATLELDDMDLQIVKEGRNETKDPGGHSPPTRSSPTPATPFTGELP